MTRRNVILLLFLVLFWGGPTVLAYYTDWLWFKDLGFAGVLRVRFLTQASLFVLGGLVSAGVILWSAFLARRLAEQAVGSVEMPGSAQMRAMERPFSMAVVGGGLLLALNMAGGAAGGGGVGGGPFGGSPLGQAALVSGCFLRSLVF